MSGEYFCIIHNKTCRSMSKTINRSYNWTYFVLIILPLCHVVINVPNINFFSIFIHVFGSSVWFIDLFSMKNQLPMHYIHQHSPTGVHLNYKILNIPRSLYTSSGIPKLSKMKWFTQSNVWLVFRSIVIWNILCIISISCYIRFTCQWVFYLMIHQCLIYM